MVQVGRDMGALERRAVLGQEVGRAAGPGRQLHLVHRLAILQKCKFRVKTRGSQQNATNAQIDLPASEKCKKYMKKARCIATQVNDSLCS